MDKNNGELWMACPCLYKEAMDKLYNTTGGDYCEIYPKKLTGYKKAKYKGWDLLAEINGEEPPRTRSKGGASDVIGAWKHFYKAQGWNKIARFDARGRLDVPYCLFKGKNVIDPEIREQKWHKARPITSTFHHPMKRLMHMVGKAWYFMARQMRGAHFIIDKTSDVPRFLEQVKSHFGDHEYVAKVLDIEGCFPNMPKDKIRQAMLEIVQDARNEGRKGVSVPVRSKKLRCSWKKLEGSFTWLSFEVMLMVLEFSLTQTICQLKDGRIIRQVAGIPMGDALSPGMTIGTCGWMEREWMRGVDTATKDNFRARRYVDDVIIFMRKHGWDRERFYADFKRSECYMPPLNLEEAEEGTFLETSFTIDHGQLRYRLKNVNAGGAKRVWRYHSFGSYAPTAQKRSTMIATLKKVDFMASDDFERFESARDKLREFADLGYPAGMRREACGVLIKERPSVAWAIVGAMQ